MDSSVNDTQKCNMGASQFRFVRMAENQFLLNPPQCPLFIVSNQSSFREWVVSNRMGVGGRLDNFSFDDGGKQGWE